MASAIATIMQELAGIDSVLASRAKLGGQAAAVHASIESNMCSSLRQHIGAVKGGSYHEWCLLMNELQNSRITDERKAWIQEAIDARISEGTAAAGGVYRPQRLTTPWNYCTQADWDVLDDAEASHAAKARVIYLRLMNLGLFQLHEQTYKALYTDGL